MVQERDEDGLIGARMLNEFTYCPRLFHLEHVQGRWAENEFTIEGARVHRRTDAKEQLLPRAGDDVDSPAPGKAEPGDAPPTVARSVTLESAALGLVAKLDLVETAGDEAVPVDAKRGRVPNVPERAYEPERVQLMAQGLLLREHGYRCEKGILWFAGSRTRVEVPFTDELERRTRSLLADARATAASDRMPAPLEDSPKCIGCSLSGICLPDETVELREDVGHGPALAASKQPAGEPRRLYPERSNALPLYVQEPRARVGKRGGTITVSVAGDVVARAPMKDVSQVILCGPVQISAQLVGELCRRDVPVVHLSSGHWLHGVTAGVSIRNAYARAAQFRAAEDPDRRNRFARAVVAAKVANQRTLLRRNATPRPERVLKDLLRMQKRAEATSGTDAMLGVEGTAARHYFSAFASMLRGREIDTGWAFTERNRRPPRDPVNAMLSFCYAMLVKECTTALLGEGLDPWWGLYHRPRHGRPGLALDLMEEFRPLLADSAVVTAVNTGMIDDGGFERVGDACMLNDRGRKAMLRAFEGRMDQLITHPRFGYRCSWRAIVAVQARLLARWLTDDLPEYVGVTTR